jgi:hypothetical protein
VKEWRFATWDAEEEGGRMPEVCKVFPFVGFREGECAEDIGGLSDDKEDGPQGGMCL